MELNWHGYLRALLGLWIIAMLLLPMHSIAQSKIEQKGLDAFNDFDYSQAIQYLKRAEYLTPTGLRSMAMSYERTGQLDSAAKYFHETIKTGFHEVEDLLSYSQILKTQGDYDRSFHWLVLYSEKRPEDSRVLRVYSDPEYYKRIMSKDAKYSARSLSCNSPMDDFAPAWYGQKAVFISAKKNMRPMRNRKVPDVPYFQRFETDVNTGGEFINIRELEGPFDSKEYDGPISYNEIADMVVYASSKTERVSATGERLYSLYSSLKFGADWEEPAPLWFNHEEYSVADPHMSKDGKSLYFSSNMPGGFGGFDLYKVTARDEGGWTFPVNLGSQINSEGDEVSPFVHEADTTLYFASDGHPGIGGLDLFAVTLREGAYKKVKNIGKPFNTSGDDVGLILADDLSSGYLASDRQGGRGGLDLYYVQSLGVSDDSIKALAQPLRAEVVMRESKEPGIEEKGGVRGKFNQGQDPQEGVILNLYNQEGDRIGIATTNDEGKFVFHGLSFYDNYVIQLADENQGVFDQSTIYFLDQEGNTVDSARTLLFNAYSFEYLPKEYAMRPNVEVVDEERDFFGRASYNGGPIGPLQLELSENMNKSDTIETDPMGYFRMEDLTLEEQFDLKVIAPDSINQNNLSIEFLDKDTNVVGLANRIDDRYTFIASKNLDEVHPEMFKGKRSRMVGKFVINSKGKDGVIISLFDQDGEYISTTTTDSMGEFSFEDLEYFRQYKLKLAEAYSDLFNGSKVLLLDEDKKPMFQADVFRFNEFTFVHLPRDVANPLDLVEEVDESVSLMGYFADGLEPKEDVRMFLLQENGLAIDTTITSVNGAFEFKELEVKKEYVLAADDSVVQEMDSARVYLINDAHPEGQAMDMHSGSILINANRFGMRMSADDDDEGGIEMKGVFLHDNLVQNGVKLLIFNEKGEKVGNAKTDQNGEFTFPGLEHYKPYTIRLSSEYIDLFESSTLYIRDTRYHVSDTALMERFNEYRFTLLPPIAIPSIEPIVAEDVPFDPKSSIKGLLRYTRFPRKDMQVYLYDGDTNRVDTFMISKSGRFSVKNLNENEPYYLWFSLVDTAVLYRAKWTVIDASSGDPISLNWTAPNIVSFIAPSIWKTPDGYAPASTPNEKLEDMDASPMNQIPKQLEQPELKPVYFRLDGDALGPEQKRQLDKVVRYMKMSPSTKLELNAYSDCRGDTDYNLNLSKRRVEKAIAYMVQQGVERNRLTGYGRGESNPVSDCKGMDCPEDQHALNRRLEFKIIN